LEHPLEEIEILASIELTLNLEDTERGPCMNRGIDIAEIPFVSAKGQLAFTSSALGYSRRKLAIRMAVPLASEEIELFLGEVRVDHGEGDAVKASVPRSKEGVLPRIRHRQDVIAMKVLPRSIADALPTRGWWRLARVTVRPLLPDEEIVLFAPHHACECLSLDIAEVISHRQGADVVVEVVGLLPLPLNDVVKLLLVEVRLGLLGKSESNDCFR
jgi:hypothetical protein